jgi:hypothetical protein
MHIMHILRLLENAFVASRRQLGREEVVELARLDLLQRDDV